MIKNIFSLFLLFCVLLVPKFSISQIKVTEQDLTGDGSLDIQIDNGIMWFQINGDDSTSLRYIAAGGLSGQPSLVESIANEQYVDRNYNRPTINSKVFSIINHTENLAVVTIEILYTSENGKPFSQKIEISLESDSKYANIKHIFKNVGSTSFSFAEPYSHIGYGLGVAIVNHSEDTNVEAYINGIGDINLTSESWYTNHNIDISKPFIINYNTSTNDAITYGFFPEYSDRNITHVMISYLRSIFIYADEMTLNPNDIVVFSGIFSFHRGGVQVGTEIYNNAQVYYTEKFSILSITDVPNDQGRHVRIKWLAHNFDSSDSTISKPVTHYSIWRKHDPNLTIHKTSGTPDGEWDFITEVPAVQDNKYSVIVPTLADSNKVNGQYYSTFFVRAHTADPTIHWETAPDSGYSVDNLSPATVSGLNAELVDDNIQLTWNENSEDDIAYYAVYRDTVNGFGPVTLNESIAVVTTPRYKDENIGNASEYYYRVTAVDYNGNESPLSNEVMVSLTSIETGMHPLTFQLYRNYPNPFNPSTTIQVSIPQRSQIQLSIFDNNGRQIRQLYSGALPQGIHTFVWNGLNDNNKPVTSGLYFITAQMETKILTRKMLLIK